MDPFPDKILALQLLDNKIRELPARLMNCLKFGMDFDKDSAQEILPRMRKDIAELGCSLRGFVDSARMVEAYKEQAIYASEANRRFFDGLMDQYGITEAEVSELIGESPVEDHPVDTARTSEDGDSLPEDDVDGDEDDSYELNKPPKM